MHSQQYRFLPVLLGAAILLTPANSHAKSEITRVSVSSSGAQANSGSSRNNSIPRISADGRFIVFESDATNLVGNDTNNSYDIFVYDRLNRQTTRVSVTSDGTEANDQSTHGAISADGRFVTFTSAATNLVTGDTNNYRDVFIHDRQIHQTKLVSVSSTGVHGNGDSDYSSVSADGRYVAFVSSASNLVLFSDYNSTSDVFIHDMQTGTTSLVSAQPNNTSGNGSSGAPSISGDGRYVTFVSYATNLVANSDTNHDLDVFVRDCQTGTTSLVSKNTSGGAGNSASTAPVISQDGRYVAFTSYATNLIANDTNHQVDVFVRELATNQTTRASLDANGNQLSTASFNPSISADGRYLSYVTNGTDTINNIFFCDRQTNQRSMVSVNADNIEGNGDSTYSTISANGKYVVFESEATNLVAGDTNGSTDVFLYGPPDFPWPMFLPAITKKR